MSRVKPNETMGVMAQEAAKAKALLKKGGGFGGKNSSLNHKKEALPEPKPKAGATIKRNINISEFRRFYDRGDLPIAMDH